MLEINQELLDLDDQIDQLVAALVQTPQARAYRKAQEALAADQEVQEEIARFKQLQDRYQGQEAYAKYRPELTQLKRQVLAQKRKVDLADSVRNFRQAEVALQEVLAQVSQQLADAVAADIFVDKGLPFTPHKRQHGQGAGENIREKED